MGWAGGRFQEWKGNLRSTSWQSVLIPGLLPSGSVQILEGERSSPIYPHLATRCSRNCPSSEPLLRRILCLECCSPSDRQILIPTILIPRPLTGTFYKPGVGGHLGRMNLSSLPNRLIRKTLLPHLIDEETEAQNEKPFAQGTQQRWQVGQVTW